MSAPYMLKEPVEAAQAVLSTGRGLFTRTDQEGEFCEAFFTVQDLIDRDRCGSNAR